MTYKLLLLGFFFIIFQNIHAQDHTLDYFLPEDVSYNKDIPKPGEILGFVPGDWHSSHDRIVQYMRRLAEASDRISIETQGFTYERRPLILLTVTSPKNHKQLDDIKEKRKVLLDNELANADFNDLPIVINQAFSVHGNEPSGANSAMVLAYYLAAAEGNRIQEILANTVILLDPNLNPDGIQRFAQWTNSNRSLNVNPDPQDREFDETWPGGRTNHYYFDLNRDWLPLQLPESRAHISTFYEWRPNILTDHHEMGSNSTYFFQPGIPERTNPFTPQLNQDLTGEIAKFHAKALDSIGSLYYSEESFDDFYYGKGSTFPDINGSIGILFEQASSRGSAQKTVNGILDFKFTIRNQFTTGLSTIEAAVNLKNDILKLQDQFFANAYDNLDKGYYVFSKGSNPFLTKELQKVLHQHEIDTYRLEETQNINGQTFQSESSVVVPVQQQQGRILQAMFESRTTFKDSIFYDVSAWDFNHAFGVDFAKSRSVERGDQFSEAINISPEEVSKSNYAYAIRWSDFKAADMAYQLFDKGLRLKTATKPFATDDASFDYGTLLLPVANQKLNSQEIYELVNSLSKQLKVKVSGLNTGLTDGINLGSPNIRSIKQPKIALMVGEGILSYDSGEIWHLFDARLHTPITKLDTKDFKAGNLDKYTHLIIPSSYGRLLPENQINQLKSWIKNGGTIIGYRNTIKWMDSNKLIDVEFETDSIVAKNIQYKDRSNFYGAKQIGGAIFEAKLDRSHPINYGYDNDKISLFRNTEIFIKPDKDSFNNPIQYTDQPLLSGYINDDNLELLKNTVPFQVDDYGRGRVIVFTDNTNFRAFWLGTMKLLINSVYFSKLM